jgi:hypothetical protein
LAPRAASKRFEVFEDAGQVRLSDGTDGGRRFALAEVIDLGQPGELDRLRTELAELTGSADAGQSIGGQR